MRTLRSLLAVAALALGGACDTDVIVIPDEVVGVWTDSLPVNQAAIWANTLTLNPSGEFHWEQISYGVPPHGPEVLTHRTVLRGRYRMRPGVLEVRTEWVEFSGAAYDGTITEEVEDPQWSGDLYRARISGDDLEISFTSYPFDRPEEILLTFTRKPPGQLIN